MNILKQQHTNYRFILLSLLLATSLPVVGQYNGLTTIYKLPQHDVLVDLENYNEHYLRQELADHIFYNYANDVSKVAPINLKDYIVEGELTVQKFSPRTIVLFYECKKFISNNR